MFAKIFNVIKKIAVVINSFISVVIAFQNVKKAFS